MTKISQLLRCHAFFAFLSLLLLLRLSFFLANDDDEAADDCDSDDDGSDDDGNDDRRRSEEEVQSTVLSLPPSPSLICSLSSCFRVSLSLRQLLSTLDQ